MKSSVKQFFLLLLLPLVLAGSLSLIYIMPERGVTAPSSLNIDLPVGYDLTGWYGEKRQESELERKKLAADTKFSKADYLKLSLGERAKLLPCHVSIVLSGEDMNSSIHRPEFCLPSQGHFNLVPGTRTLKLDNGREMSFTRLDSLINISPDSKKPQLLRSMNYHVFVGYKTFTHRHEYRVLLDMKRRVFNGQDQRWAYIQTGVYYGNLIGVSEQEAEATLEALLKQLLPLIIKWDEVDS